MGQGDASQGAPRWREKNEIMKHLTPIYDRVLIQVRKEAEKTPGGLFIPQAAQEKPLEGEVLAVGTGHQMNDGSIRPCIVKPGDVVLFGKFSGTEVKSLGDDRLVLHENDILGIVTER